MNSLDVLRNGPVIPVIIIDDVKKAVAMAKALVNGGVNVLEITLRTAAALDSIRAICAEVPEAIVGVGTVLSPEQFEKSKNAGAKFAISPGFTPSMVKLADEVGLPYVPGVTTPSEVMMAMELGLSALKFFPAEASGGTAMLKSLMSPFPTVKFCPTGGIGIQNAPSYLALSNVLCVGGSWIVPSDAIKEEQWGIITALAKDTLALKKM